MIIYRALLPAFAAGALLSSPVAAQDDPAQPSGPPPAEAPPLPPGHPPTEVPHDHRPTAGQPAQAQQPTPAEQQAVRRSTASPSTTVARPSEDVPAGTIRIQVVDERGQPVPNAEVGVGVLAQGDREQRTARAGADGVALFEGLATGGGQAYRAKVIYRGATYGSTPFRLPEDTGYDVQITRLPVTTDLEALLLFYGRTILEVRDERLHVLHGAQLANISAETIVFPADGLRMPLPEGAINFQAQAVMTDQKIEEVSGSARLRGSLPPGRVELAWAYDLPIRGQTSMDLEVEIPFKTYRYQVIAEAIEGLRLDVAGMETPQRVPSNGHEFLVSSIVRGPASAPFDRIGIRVDGIPGPGPARLISLGLAVLLAIFGLVGLVYGTFVRGRVADRRAARQEVSRLRDELLAEARELAEDRAADEVGPEYVERRRRQLVRRLAELLHEEDALGRARSASS